MNERIIEIGLESGMLNYVDNETPRHYFLSGHADEQDLSRFAQLIVQECISMADKESERYSNLNQEYCSMAMDNYRELVRKHFGVEE